MVTQNIELIRENVNGVEGSFLIKSGEVMECDFDAETLHFISRSILFMVESFTENEKELSKMSIVADNYCLIYFYEKYVLGVVTSESTNFPLLEMVSNKLLHTIEVAPEKVEEIIDEVLERMGDFIS